MTDAAGNNAVQVTRTVNVVDNNPSLPVNPWLVAMALLVAGPAALGIALRRAQQP